MLLWTLGCMYLFELMFSFSSDIYTLVELLDHMVFLFLVFWGLSILFSTVAALIHMPTIVYKSSLFSTFLPVPVLVPTDWWVGMELGPEANKLEGGFHDGTFQYQCYYGRMSSQKWLLPASLSPGGVPVASCLSRRLSKISRWVWLRLLSNYCFCPRSRSVWNFVCLL